jgi:FkbM family methyltransferase
MWDRYVLAFAQLLCRIVWSTGSGPLTVALRKVFRFKRRSVTTNRGVFRVDPFSFFGYFIVRDGEYEPELLHFLASQLSEGDTFIDAGAHEGYFTTVAARLVGPSGRVIAIEPQGRVLPILKANVKANGLTNVSIVPCGISDREGQGRLSLDMGFNTGGTGFTNISRFKLPTELVRVRPLDAILEEQGVADVALIKMDIEGFEYELILGSAELFKEHKVRTLAIELHGRQMRMRGKRPEDISEFLLGCGYTLDPNESNNLGTDFATMVFNRPVGVIENIHPNGTTSRGDLK